MRKQLLSLLIAAQPGCVFYMDGHTVAAESVPRPRPNFEMSEQIHQPIYMWSCNGTTCTPPEPGAHWHLGEGNFGATLSKIGLVCSHQCWKLTGCRTYCW